MNQWLGKDLEVNRQSRFAFHETPSFHGFNMMSFIHLSLSRDAF